MGSTASLIFAQRATYSAMLFFLSLISIAVCLGFRGIGANSAFTNARSSGSALSVKKGISLEDLPYGYTALEPHISERTLRFHHDKHHAKYVATANDIIKGTDMENDDVVTIIRKTFGQNQGLFNNAGQAFNHEFYWNSMKPNGGGLPTGRIAGLIEKDLGGYDKFRKDFSNAAMTAFGSGWAWLSLTPAGLKISNTIGANNPLTEAGHVPLLTCDVWEHAYYLDYQNLRNNYVDTFLDHLVNWDAVNARLPSKSEL